jgi:hypothetical protein
MYLAPRFVHVHCSPLRFQCTNKDLSLATFPSTCGYVQQNFSNTINDQYVAACLSIGRAAAKMPLPSFIKAELESINPLTTQESDYYGAYNILLGHAFPRQTATSSILKSFPTLLSTKFPI